MYLDSSLSSIGFLFTDNQYYLQKTTGYDSCAIHAHVTLLREGAGTSSISAASWITAADNWDD